MARFCGHGIYVSEEYVFMCHRVGLGGVGLCDNVSWSMGIEDVGTHNVAGVSSSLYTLMHLVQFTAVMREVRVDFARRTISSSKTLREPHHARP